MSTNLVYYISLLYILSLCHCFTALSLTNCPLKSDDSDDTIRVLANSIPPVTAIKFNATGHVIEASGYGPYMLDLMAHQINKQYCWVPLGREWLFDDGPNATGMASLLRNGVGNFVLAPLARRLDRFQTIDFTVPIADGPYGIMIPFPRQSINNSALWQPFQKEVWLCLIVALIAVVFTLPLIGSGRLNSRLYRHFSYAMAVLLAQGDYFASQRLASRLTASAWCLVAFVLVSAYSGTLLSFIVLPVQLPVVNSIYDTANVPGLKVALDKAKAPEGTLRDIMKYGTNTTLGRVASAIIKTKSPCDGMEECVAKVLQGGHVYIHGSMVIDQIMLNDVRKTGECRFAKAKEEFNSGLLVWGLNKKSPLLRVVDKAILEQDAFGLSNVWKARFLKKADKCVNPDRLPVSRLSLRQLSSAFALLGIGNMLGFGAFVLEITWPLLLRHAKRV